MSMQNCEMEEHMATSFFPPSPPLSRFPHSIPFMKHVVQAIQKEEIAALYTICGTNLWNLVNHLDSIVVFNIIQILVFLTIYNDIFSRSPLINCLMKVHEFNACRQSNLAECSIFYFLCNLKPKVHSLVIFIICLDLKKVAILTRIRILYYICL